MDSTERHICAVIPGVSLDKKEPTSQTFIQLLDGITAKMSYYRFPSEQFLASENNLRSRLARAIFRRGDFTLTSTREEAGS
nr:hypothetical protein [Candidatus Njordarchaeota archaeon]